MEYGNEILCNSASFSCARSIYRLEFETQPRNRNVIMKNLVSSCSTRLLLICLAAAALAKAQGPEIVDQTSGVSVSDKLVWGSNEKWIVLASTYSASSIRVFDLETKRVAR